MANDVIARGMVIEKQRKSNAELEAEIVEIKHQILKAKEMHNTLHSKYTAKK